MYALRHALRTLDDAIQLSFFSLLGMVQVPTKLDIQPEVSRGSEVFCQAQRRTRRDTPFAVDDLVNPLVGNVDGVSQVALREQHGFEKLLDQHFAWMSRCTIGWNTNHSCPSNDNRQFPPDLALFQSR